MGFSLDPDRERPPKRLGAIFGLYDQPAYRDWLLWWTVAWMVIAGLSVAFPAQGYQRSDSLPTWLDALLAVVVFGLLFGALPAYVRLVIRRGRIRRTRANAGTSSTTTPAAPRVAYPGPPPEHQAKQETDAPRQPSHGEGSSTGTTPPQKASAAGPSARKASPAPGPTPVTVLDVSRVRDSPSLIRARSVLPYPIARAARAVQQATDAKDTYEAVLRAGEATTIVLGITAAAWARDNDVTTPELRSLQEAFLHRGVSQGHWLDAAKSVERPMYQHAFEIAGMVDALKTGKGGTGLLADLKRLVEERNLWAHGGGPHNRVEAGERLAALLPPLEKAIDRLGYLAEAPWILVNDLKLRRRETDFQVQASRAMGDHPDFDYSDFTTTQALAEDVFYLMTPQRLIDLTPLVVMRTCPTCHQREVAYADRIDSRSGVALKTFDRGHLLFDATLLDEIRTLVVDLRQDGAESV